ncbi:Hypothetical predicted protein [Cloeon dipterum]|uniref:Ionotropic glutamate receptor C-terminal domain-containing protein n=1 Tax=Cloeon dipterum TaxID=197152 RepID=A0A8S1CZ29_9INSE|nr:Hypothetical predicted protein [Cloeon dipterum]
MLRITSAILFIIFLSRSSAFNFNCILDLCERFHINNLQFHNFLQDRNFDRLLPAHFEEFSRRGIRVAEQKISEGESVLIHNLSRGLHALNTAYLFFNIDPAYQIGSVPMQDDLGTTPSLFIFSFLGIRGGMTVDETLEDSLAQIDLKYDSRAYAMFQSSPQTIFEVYKVSRYRKLTTSKFNRFSPNSLKSLPLIDVKSSVTRSRSNLQAVKITGLAACLSSDPLAEFDEWTRAYVTIWRQLAHNLNFTFSIKRVKENLLPEASWSSMLEEIELGIADISLSPIIMLPSFANKTDFSAPIHRVSFSVLMRATASERIRWTNFLLPFHSTLWMSILAAILVLSTVLALFWKSEFERQHNTNLSFIEIFSEAFVCIHGASCMQGHPAPPITFSARALHLSALLSAVVVMATYSGSVTAFLTVRVDNQPFSNFDDLLRSSRFRPFVLENSPESSFFHESQHASMIKFRAKGAPSTVAKLSTAMQIACNKNYSLPAPWSKMIPAFVVATHWVDRILDTAPCALSDFPLSMQSFWAAFPMRPKFPYKRILDNRQVIYFIYLLID